MEPTNPELQAAEVETEVRADASDVYYAVINRAAVEAEEAVTFCRTDGGDIHIHRDRETALAARNRLQAAFANPDIHVYRIRVDTEHLGWEDAAGTQ